MRKWEPRLSHQSYLFLSLVLFFRYFLFPATALSHSFSPDLSMPKIHRMKEERGREGGERGEKGGRKEEDPNQKSLSIQTDGKKATWDLFVNNR